MSSVSCSFPSELHSADPVSPCSSVPTQSVVVVNGALSSAMSPKATGGSQRVTSSGTPPLAQVSSSISTTSLFSIVPTLTTTSRVTVSSAATDTVSSSSALNKNAIVGSSSSPQIIVVSEGDGSLDSTSDVAPGGGNPTQTVNLGVGETYVQYVDAPPDPLYAHANGQMAAFPVYTVGDTTMYAASSTFYTACSTSGSFSAQEINSANGTPLLATGNNTFILQSDVEPDPPPLISSSRHSPQTDGVTFMVSGDGSSDALADSGTPNLDAETQANIAHASRVSPCTVQWLLDNYETAEGVSLPRSTLYNHYLYHCADQKLDPVNSASFGKLIRSVFLGLRTRRLGTRGNSKYHYYGIRIKSSSTMNNLSEDGSQVVIWGQGGQLKKETSHHDAQERTHPGRGVSSTATGKSVEYSESIGPTLAESSPQTLQNQQYLGDVSKALPMLPDINLTSSTSPDLMKQHVEAFRAMYQEHCENILEVIYSLQFHLMETIWRRFWAFGNNNEVSNDKLSPNEPGAEDEKGELTARFSSNVLQHMMKSPPVLEFVKAVDYQFYQNIVDVLIPDVLRSIPSQLTQSIRNFAKSLESWLATALLGYPNELVEVKLTAVSSLAQTLRRYTSLNHLAQAARAVLQNSTQISQMLSDLNRVDFHNVQEQASWVCQCDVALVERLEEDFKATLQQQNSLEQWAEWLQTVVDQTLIPQEGNPNFSKYARQFLLKWSFYSSMVIRDLTLRSASSFGSFHLIRLLYDEYMFYLVEHKVASSMGLSPIAVMSQFLTSSKVQNKPEAQNSDVSGITGCNGDVPSSSVVKRQKFEDS